MTADLTSEMQRLLTTLKDRDEADRARVQRHIDNLTATYTSRFLSAKTEKERSLILLELATINHGGIIQGFNEHAIALIPLFRAIGYLKLLATLNLLGLIGLATWLYFGW